MECHQHNTCSQAEHWSCTNLVQRALTPCWKKIFYSTWLSFDMSNFGHIHSFIYVKHRVVHRASKQCSSWTSQSNNDEPVSLLSTSEKGGKSFDHLGFTCLIVSVSFDLLQCFGSMFSRSSGRSSNSTIAGPTSESSWSFSSSLAVQLPKNACEDSFLSWAQ